MCPLCSLNILDVKIEAWLLLGQWVNSRHCGHLCNQIACTFTLSQPVSSFSEFFTPVFITFWVDFFLCFFFYSINYFAMFSLADVTAGSASVLLPPVFFFGLSLKALHGVSICKCSCSSVYRCHPVSGNSNIKKTLSPRSSPAVLLQDELKSSKDSCLNFGILH